MNRNKDSHKDRESFEPEHEKSGTAAMIRRIAVWAVVIAMCIALLCGCSAADKKDVVHIGVTPQMSTRLVGWMVCELAERKGIECEIVDVPDGISNLQPPLENGSIQIGVELAQSAWNSVLNERTVFTAPDLLELIHEYKKRQLYWEPLPLAKDIYSIAITKKLAMENDIQTLSELAKISDTLTLGAPTQYFEDADGYPWMSENYGITFKTTKNLPPEMLVDSLRDETVDAIPIHTIDGMMRRDEQVILEDDLDTCPGSELGLVIREETLMEHPELMEIVSQLARTVTSAKLAEYGRLVLNNDLEVHDAAMTFLKGNDLVIETPEDVARRRVHLHQQEQ